MSITIGCPRTSCDFHANVKTQLSHKYIRCPDCNTKFQVPEAQAENITFQKQPSTRRPTARRTDLRRRVGPSIAPRRAPIGMTARSARTRTTVPSHTFAEAVFPMRLFSWGVGLTVLGMAGGFVLGLFHTLAPSLVKPMYLGLYSIVLISQAFIFAGVVGLAFIRVSTIYTILMGLSVGCYSIPFLLVATGSAELMTGSIVMIIAMNALALPLFCFAQGNFCDRGNLNGLGGHWKFYGFCQLILSAGSAALLAMFGIENVGVLLIATCAILLITLFILFQIWRLGLDTTDALRVMANRMLALRNTTVGSSLLLKRCISIAIVVIVIIVSWNYSPAMAIFRQ